MLRHSRTDAEKSELLKHDVSGGFTEPIYQALREELQLILDVSELFLERNSPATLLHDDICAAVGLERGLLISRKQLQRDPDFRPRVLAAYSFRCAVCGFDMRLGQRTIGLEAAHIKWHQAGGPSTVDNGLSLCVMHHKLLDLGAYTLPDERQALVSDQAYGYWQY